MAAVAKSYPHKYEEIAQHIADTGRNASYDQGESLTLRDMLPVLDRDAVLAQMDSEIAQAKQESRNHDEFHQKRMGIWGRYSQLLEKETQKAAMRQNNNLAYSVVSGARGKPAQLKMMLSTPGIYEDYKGNPVPLFVRHSFGEGLRPAEYLAGTFGARQTVLSTKRSTAKGGDLSKQMVQAAAAITVSRKDCGTDNGIDLELDDPSLRNRVLAQNTAGIPAGTILDKTALDHLRKTKTAKVMVRSALTCTADHGICAKCVGAGPTGKLPAIGDAAGITAAQALGEPITQMALNSKHTGGVAGQKREYSGFGYINQIVQSPETFPDRATVAEHDGTVESITDAPQGGSYVRIAGEDHYIHPGYPVLVKPGEKVEAGDQLSDGLVDAGDMVRLRGLGEGRRYYADRLKKVLDDSGMPADRRNTEMMARAAIDHVRIEDPEGLGDSLPDDVVSYNRLSSKYVPPEDSKELEPRHAHGQYLQVPALHYTIGTRITPKVAQRISDAGFKTIYASPSQPGFAPEMVRLRAAAHVNPDWLASQHTSFLSKQLGDAAVRAEDTDIDANSHFAPRLAVGQGFGANVHETGKF